MDILEDFDSKLKELDKLIAVNEVKIQTIDDEISEIERSIEVHEHQNDTLSKAIMVLNESGRISRDSAKKNFETIITNALQFVSQDQNCEFIIDNKESKTGKPSYEFLVKNTINGIESIHKPEASNGGGFVDIISTTIKYAYLAIFNDPKIMSGTLFYDEPAKMVSAQMSTKFAEYIKFLGTQYDKQTIMITHNENLTNIADRTFEVYKDGNGVSHVQDYSSLSNELNDIFADFNEDLKGLING